MATKRKTKKRASQSKSKSKRTAVKKAAPPKKHAKKAKPVKKVVKKKPAPKKAPAKRAAAKKTSRAKKRTRGSSQPKELAAFLPVGPGSDSAGQSGDLQGLSNVEGADSESVDELLEEGNSFEAEVIAGVEDAGDSEKEVHTHEVPEDDVPGEYLDKD
jgi:outer membrane biosynthesis protein TonB